FLISIVRLLAATPEANLRFKLTPRHTSPSNVQLVFTLTNHDEQPIAVLNWLTPLEGILGIIFDVRCDGRELPYKGPMVKREPPSHADFVTTPGKGTVEAVVNLSEVYEFPTPGNCQVRFSGRLLEVRSPNGEVKRDVGIDGESISFLLRI